MIKTDYLPSPEVSAKARQQDVAQVNKPNASEHTLMDHRGNEGLLHSYNQWSADLRRYEKHHSQEPQTLANAGDCVPDHMNPPSILEWSAVACQLKMGKYLCHGVVTLDIDAIITYCGVSCRRVVIALGHPLPTITQ